MSHESGRERKIFLSRISWTLPFKVANLEDDVSKASDTVRGTLGIALTPQFLIDSPYPLS